MTRRITSLCNCIAIFCLVSCHRTCLYDGTCHHTCTCVSIVVHGIVYVHMVVHAFVHVHMAVHAFVHMFIWWYMCDGTASLGNMQISNSRLCELSKCCVYSAVNHHWWMSMLFHRRGLLWLGSAVCYQAARLPDRSCLTHVVPRPRLGTSLLGGGSNVTG